MAYCMRYISTDAEPLTLEALEAALQANDTAYSIRRSGRAGKLMYGRGLYAFLDIERVSGGNEEIDELRELVEASDSDAKQVVLDVLKRATDLLTIEVKWQSRSTDATLDRFGPMWDWLIANRSGLIQADGEGFYQGQELLLDTETTVKRKKHGVPCPQCGAPLRTERAKQCFNCGADWHDSASLRN